MQVLSDLPQPNQTIITGNVHLHDRELGHIDLDYAGVVSRRGQLGFCHIHPFPHFLEGLVHVHSSHKLDVDLGVAFSRYGGDFLHVGNRV